MYRSFLFSLISVIYFIALFLVPSQSLTAQTNRTIEETEGGLKALFDSILSYSEDDDRIRSAVTFSVRFHQILTMDGSFEHSFSLLPALSKLTSPDGKLRIYTWNIPLHSGMNRFYGIIQLSRNAGDTPVVIDLLDQAEKIPSPDKEVFSPGNWFGAVYYKLIPGQTMHGDLFYTLLGWRGENMLMNSKLIEVLTISPAGEVHFGKKVFCNYPDDQLTRILFPHSANVIISLRYEEQSVVTNKKWNSRRKRFTYKHEKDWLIVCDRLVPSNPQLEGHYEYYIPAGDVMDGFIFKDGCWNFIRQIDALNPGEK